MDKNDVIIVRIYVEVKISNSTSPNSHNEQLTI